jgi:hypothetical protein
MPGNDRDDLEKVCVDLPLSKLANERGSCKAAVRSLGVMRVKILRSRKDS